MSAPRLVLALLVAFGLSVALVAAGVMRSRTRGGAEQVASRGGPTYDVLWSVPDFTYRDQHDELVTPSSLRGQVWVANFIFTQCRSVCPLITTKMLQLSRRLSGVPVRFVSFSVDPAHDTPAVLKAYAESWAPDEKRWTLLSTTLSSLPSLTSGFRITRQEQDDAIDPIVHSSVFVLVDAAGNARGAFDSEHGDAFAELERGVRLLLGGNLTAGAPLPDAAADLYHALSCANCHERPELAPPLLDLRGKRRELDTGLVVTADAAWVRESILLPEVKRVRGYPLRMPSYAGLLDEARLGALTEWLLERRGVSDDATTQVVVDPVCEMQVRVVPDTPTARLGERTFHFCSQLCRDKLVAAPSRYVGAAR